MDKLFEECTSRLKMYSAVHTNGQCIYWNGCINKKGYGQFRFKDPRDPPAAGHRTRTAHRVALMVAKGDFDLPPSQQASHLCNNKLCVNVEHLSLETNSINNARKTCFSLFRCSGHFSDAGDRLPDCKIDLWDGSS